MLTIDDIHVAAKRLTPYLVPTPLLESQALNEHVGGRLLMKAECLQVTGSFKIRGALNRLLQLTEAEKTNGVVAYSSGNHAQGVALAAKITGVPATIVMPADAPQMKINKTKGYGATVVLYDRYTENREEIAAGIVHEKQAVLVPPFDDERIIAGQGTTALEVLSQAKALGIESLDQFVTCFSGGGLSAGCAVVLCEQKGLQYYTAEPAGYDDMALSLSSGERTAITPGVPSICDALMNPVPGELTFPILKDCGAKGISVTDDEVRAAMCSAFEHLKLVIEPGGAVALASALTGKIETRDKTTVVVCTGGNVDAGFYAETLSG